LRTVRMVVPCQRPVSEADMLWKSIVRGMI
jgi:hypothetical protein